MIAQDIGNSYRNKSYHRIFTNFLLRGLTLVAKFGLTIFLAKYISSDVLGQYTVFLTTVTICIYILGFEFYTYSQREYKYNDISSLVAQLRDQSIFYILAYLVLVPIAILFGENYIKSNLLLFALILILEHINQELYRLHVALNKPISATFNNFLRSGVWAILYVSLGLANPQLINLKFLYYLWLIGEILCLVFSIYVISYLNWGSIWQTKINWLWIRRGVSVSTVFFLSGITLKMIEYSERFFLKEIIGDAALGVYFFFYNIAYLPYSFFTTVIVINFLPNLIKGFKEENKSFYFESKKKFYVATKNYVFVAYILTILGYLFVTNYYLSDPIYKINQNIFWGQLTASAFTILSEVYYVELYIRHKDGLILKTFILALIIHFISNFVFISHYGIYGAVIAKVIVALVLLFSRIFVLKRSIYDR